MGEELYERSACSALVITCSDFRFKSAERAFAASAALLDDYDLIARPGAARSLVSPRNAAARQTMEEEITILWRLHGFTRVLAVHHESCAAYSDLATGDAQRAFHEQHLRSAGQVVESLCDGVTAEGYIIAVGGKAHRVV